MVKSIAGFAVDSKVNAVFLAASSNKGEESDVSVFNIACKGDSFS